MKYAFVFHEISFLNIFILEKVQMKYLLSKVSLKDNVSYYYIKKPLLSKN
jgi:hypothetical protein